MGVGLILGVMLVLVPVRFGFFSEGSIRLSSAARALPKRVFPGKRNKKIAKISFFKLFLKTCKIHQYGNNTYVGLISLQNCTGVLLARSYLNCKECYLYILCIGNATTILIR